MNDFLPILSGLAGGAMQGLVDKRARELKAAALQRQKDADAATKAYRGEMLGLARERLGETARSNEIAQDTKDAEFRRDIINDIDKNVDFFAGQIKTDFERGLDPNNLDRTTFPAWVEGLQKNTAQNVENFVRQYQTVNGVSRDFALGRIIPKLPYLLQPTYDAGGNVLFKNASLGLATLPTQIREQLFADYSKIVGDAARLSTSPDAYQSYLRVVAPSLYNRASKFLTDDEIQQAFPLLRQVDIESTRSYRPVLERGIADPNSLSRFADIVNRTGNYGAKLSTVPPQGGSISSAQIAQDLASQDIADLVNRGMTGLPPSGASTTGQVDEIQKLMETGRGVGNINQVIQGMRNVPIGAAALLQSAYAKTPVNNTVRTSMYQPMAPSEEQKVELDKKRADLAMANFQLRSEPLMKAQQYQINELKAKIDEFNADLSGKKYNLNVKEYGLQEAAHGLKQNAQTFDQLAKQVELAGSFYKTIQSDVDKAYQKLQSSLRGGALLSAIEGGENTKLKDALTKIRDGKKISELSPDEQKAIASPVGQNKALISKFIADIKSKESKSNAARDAYSRMNNLFNRIMKTKAVIDEGLSPQDQALLDAIEGDSEEAPVIRPRVVQPVGGSGSGSSPSATGKRGGGS